MQLLAEEGIIFGSILNSSLLTIKRLGVRNKRAAEASHPSLFLKVCSALI